jgi:hypothetical protein
VDSGGTGSWQFEVLTAELLKIEALWDVTLFRWVTASRRFEGLWCLRLPGQAVYFLIVLDAEEAPATRRRMSDDVSVGYYVMICPFCVVLMRT